MHHTRAVTSTGKFFAGFTLLALSISFASCRNAEQPQVVEVETPRPTQSYDIKDFLDTTSYTGASFSPDKTKLLVSNDASGVWNAYALPIDGGEPEQLTNSQDSVFVLGYFPGDERALYSSDVGGNELNHVYVREIDGTTTDLTPGEGLKAAFGGFTQDDQTFLIATNERDQRFFDVYEYATDGYQRSMLYKNEAGYNFEDISPDKSLMAFSKIVDNANSDLYLYDIASGDMRHVTPHEGDVIHTSAVFSPDNQSLYYTTDADSEVRYLVRMSIDSGDRETIFESEWDVSYAAFSKQGSYFLIAINNDAKTELKAFRVGDNGHALEPMALPTLENAEITGLSVSHDETMMAFYGSSSRAPRDLFVATIDGDQPRQLTRSLSAKIDAEDLVEAEVVRFASFDGVEIPGILYSPHQAKEKGAKLPALVWVHGGPGGQSRVGYSALIQYLVNHGYVVYAINNRGSSGYGKTFFHLDDQDHGKGDLQDCIASKQMLIDTGYVDPERIGIIGGSYGGFMVLAALTFEPEEFGIGVNIFGVANWLRTVKSVPPWWEAQRKALEKELGSFDDEEYLRSISPFFHAENIVRPLMVLQGANDPRVLQAESDDIVAAARKNGVPVEYIVFDDEGHGFRKKENQERGYRAILEFANTYLKGEGYKAQQAGDAGDQAPADASH